MQINKAFGKKQLILNELFFKLVKKWITKNVLKMRKICEIVN